MHNNRIESQDCFFEVLILSCKMIESSSANSQGFFVGRAQYTDMSLNTSSTSSTSHPSHPTQRWVCVLHRRCPWSRWRYEGWYFSSATRVEEPSSCSVEWRDPWRKVQKPSSAKTADTSMCGIFTIYLPACFFFPICLVKVGKM